MDTQHCRLSLWSPICQVWLSYVWYLIGTPLPVIAHAAWTRCKGVKADPAWPLLGPIPDQARTQPKPPPPHASVGGVSAAWHTTRQKRKCRSPSMPQHMDLDVDQDPLPGFQRVPRGFGPRRAVYWVHGLEPPGYAQCLWAGRGSGDGCTHRAGALHPSFGLHFENAQGLPAGSVAACHGAP